MKEREVAPERPAARELTRPAAGPPIATRDPGATGHPVLRLQQAAGNGAVGRLLAQRRAQAKLEIGAPGDAYEEEADRVADRVLLMADPAVAGVSARAAPHGVARCSCGGTCGPCAPETGADTRDDAVMLQRAEAGPLSAAPPSVSAVLQKPGEPLDGTIRAFMEPRFGMDFSPVRIHRDADAARSARDVNALAYTVGDQIVFASGRYQPDTPSGRHLLAHELSHVVQQGAADPLDGPGARQPLPSTLRRRPATLQRILACESLLREREAVRVNGNAAHDAILEDFLGEAGPNGVRRFEIPGASTAPYNDAECTEDPSSTVARPQQFSPSRRQGFGVADLAFRDGDSIELAEIKPAIFGCIDDAERQVNYYVREANRGRSALGIRSARRMPMGRYHPSQVQVGREWVSVQWCSAGVVVYKAIRDRDPEIFLCSRLSDRGATDEFLDRVLGRAQAAVSRYVDRQLEPLIERALERLTVRQAINALYRYGRPTLERLVREHLGPAGPALLPESGQVDQLAGWIQDRLGAQGEQLLRAITQQVKLILMTEVRQRMQDAVRSQLQLGLNALCATAAAITARQLLRWLDQQMRRLAQQVIEAAVVAIAARVLAAIQRILQDVAAALAIVILAIAAVVLAVVTVVLLIDPIPGDEAVPGAALVAVTRLIQQLARSLAPAATGGGLVRAFGH